MIVLLGYANPNHENATVHRSMPRVWLISIFLLMASNSIATPVFPEGDIALFHINADQQTALEIGQVLGLQSKALFPNIERDYDTHLSTILSQTKFKQIQKTILPNLLQALDTKYQKELKGVAIAWALGNVNKLGDGLLSVDEYHTLNLLADIGLPPDGTGFGVLGRASVENTPIVGRNMDWANTPELRSLQAISVYQYTEKTVVNVGFAGIISVLSGYNDQGLFLAHFNAEPSSTYKNIRPPSPKTSASAFDLRKALESNTTIRQATAYLTSKFYTYSNVILMADKNTVEILEYSKTGVSKVRHWNSPTRPDKPWRRKLQIAAIDCHVLATMKNNCKAAKETYRWERLRALAQFSPTQPANINDLSNILLDTKNHLFEIFNQQTIQSMIYLPKNGSLYLYTNSPNSINRTHKLYQNILLSELPSKNKTWLPGLLLLILSAPIVWLVLRNRFK